MGNSVGLSIILDNDDSDTITTKQYMNGKVHAVVKRAVPSSAVSIEFVVFEYSYVFRRLQEGRATRNLHREIKQLRKDKGGTIPPGVYSYNFKFLVSGKLPATFRHRTGNEEIKVVYKLIARGGDGSRVRCERELTAVSRPILEKIAPHAVGPKEVPIKAFPLRTKGSVGMALTINRTRVGKEQTIQCRVAVRNVSDVPCARVRLAIVENRKWATDDKPFFEPKRREREEVVVEQDVTSLPGVSIEPAESSFNGEIRTAMLSNLDAGDNVVDLIIPLDTWDSYSGKLVVISHAVRLDVETSSRGLGTPRLEIPIQIGETVTSVSSKLSRLTLQSTKQLELKVEEEPDTAKEENQTDGTSRSNVEDDDEAETSEERPSDPE